MRTYALLLNLTPILGNHFERASMLSGESVKIAIGYCDRAPQDFAAGRTVDASTTDWTILDHSPSVTIIEAPLGMEFGSELASTPLEPGLLRLVVTHAGVQFGAVITVMPREACDDQFVRQALHGRIRDDDEARQIVVGVGTRCSADAARAELPKMAREGKRINGMSPERRAISGLSAGYVYLSGENLQRLGITGGLASVCEMRP